MVIPVSSFIHMVTPVFSSFHMVTSVVVIYLNPTFKYRNSCLHHSSISIQTSLHLFIRSFPSLYLSIESLLSLHLFILLLLSLSFHQMHHSNTEITVSIIHQYQFKPIFIILRSFPSLHFFIQSLLSLCLFIWLLPCLSFHQIHHSNMGIPVSIIHIFQFKHIFIYYYGHSCLFIYQYSHSCLFVFSHSYFHLCHSIKYITQIWEFLSSSFIDINSNLSSS